MLFLSIKTKIKILRENTGKYFHNFPHRTQKAININGKKLANWNLSKLEAEAEGL
jgi:hypothetical protein